MAQTPQGIPVELKTCEYCGRLFCRPTDPGKRWDLATKMWVAKTKDKICVSCAHQPPVEDENVYVQRSFRLLGVKI